MSSQTSLLAALAAVEWDCCARQSQLLASGLLCQLSVDDDPDRRLLESVPVRQPDSMMTRAVF